MPVKVVSDLLEFDVIGSRSFNINNVNLFNGRKSLIRYLVIFVEIKRLINEIKKKYCF